MGGGLREMSEANKFTLKEVPAADKEDDSEAVRECRRRLIGALEDMRDFGYL